MQDRLIAGAIAGSIGSFLQILYGLATKTIGLTDRTFTDFAKIFMMFKNYSGALAFITGFIVQILIGAILGIVFGYLIKITSNRYFFVKGLGLGAVFWLTFGVAGTVFELPLFKNIPPNAALVTLVGSLIYGWTTAYVLKYLETHTQIV